jgi:hypothetical protein
MHVFSPPPQLCATAAAALFLISACATTQTVHQDTNPASRFSSYKTFGFLSPLATDSDALKDPGPAIDTLVTNT